MTTTNIEQTLPDLERREKEIIEKVKQYFVKNGNNLTKTGPIRVLIDTYDHCSNYPNCHPLSAGGLFSK